jgi:hypothetical protein
LTETLSKPLPEIRSQHRLQVTNSLLDGEVKVGNCHSETGLEWQIRDRPSPRNPSPKTALKISSIQQFGYCTGRSKRENATPRRVTCRKFETGPKTVRIRKVSVNPDSDQKIQKCRGRDRGVVTKIFSTLSKFKNWPRPSVTISPKSTLNTSFKSQIRY